MAKVKPRLNPLRHAATVFMRLRLPPDFIIPDLASDEDDTDPATEEDDKPEWAKCFKALRQVPDFCYAQCGRLVDDPAMAIFFISAFSPEALEALLEGSLFRDCLATLGLEQPPPYFRTSGLVWQMDLTFSDLKQTRITMATFSFPSPATPEDREAFQTEVGMVPLSGLYYELSPFGWSSKTLGPRPTKVWVCGPQTLPDGREAENALLIQTWRDPEAEDAAAFEELEKRERWMRGMTSRLGLLAISVERYDIYRL